MLYLIDSLIPQVSPHLHVCACGDKRYVINAEPLRKNPEKFFVLFPQILAFIEFNHCAENEKKRNYNLLSKAVTGVDFKPLVQTKFNKYPQSFGPLAQKTLQELDKMTDVNSLMVGFFKALARGQETVTLPNKKFNQSRSSPQQGEKKIFATAQYTVDTQKILTLLTSLPVQKISPSAFTNFFLESILSSLDASYAQKLPQNLQQIAS